MQPAPVEPPNDCSAAEPRLLTLTTGGRASLCDPEHHVDFYALGGSALHTSLRQIQRDRFDLGAWLVLCVSIEAVREGCRRMGMRWVK